MPQNFEDVSNLNNCNMMTTSSIYTSEFLMNIVCPGANSGLGYRILLLPKPSSSTYKEDEDDEDDNDDDFESDDFLDDDDDDDDLI